MSSTKSLSSQELIDDFWRTKSPPAESPLKALTILPRNASSQMIEQHVWKATTSTTSITASYDVAKTACNAKIAQIVNECKRKNKKFSDIDFDLDDKYESTNELFARKSISSSPSPSKPSNRSVSPSSRLRFPGCVKRVGDIFENPQFFVEETTAKSIHQGGSETCWFVAAISSIRNCKPRQDLIKRICLDRDEEVGIYGFLFFRDGEWISVIVDDKLYLRTVDYEDLGNGQRNAWEDNRVRLDAVEQYRKFNQTNSIALVYAHSAHPDETWVPLLEKAFAKAHGDYEAISGGSIGNGIEDLTGGTTTKIYTNDVLSKNRLWEESLCKVNDEFLFGCATHTLDDPYNAGRDGIYSDHAYSILRAECYGEERLLMIMNPWGRAEWNGPWSDGSSQWTAEAIKELGHVFGDDGVFWIRFEDFLRKFKILYQTRLFTADWNVTQRWTSLVVPWAGHYEHIKFRITLAKASSTVIVLSQLDDQYFRGLEGQYVFWISFRLYECNQADYITSSGGEDSTHRSVSVELDLEAGTYEVRMKIYAARTEDADKVEDVVKSNWIARREKLLRIGLSYDLAHAKPQLNGTGVGEDGALNAAAHTSVVERALMTEGNPLLGEKKENEGAEDRNVRGRSLEKEKPQKGKKITREPSEEPWDASCVVGLRVYTKNSDAIIEVIDSSRAKADKTMLVIEETPEDAAFFISSIT